MRKEVFSSTSNQVEEILDTPTLNRTNTKRTIEVSKMVEHFLRRLSENFIKSFNQKRTEFHEVIEALQAHFLTKLQSRQIRNSEPEESQEKSHQITNEEAEQFFINNFFFRIVLPDFGKLIEIFTYNELPEVKSIGEDLKILRTTIKTIVDKKEGKPSNNNASDKEEVKGPKSAF